MWNPIRALTSNTSRPAKWLINWVAGDESDSGIPMSSAGALAYSSVWQAVNVLAGDVGQLPLDLYARKGDGDREKARNHPAYALARREANPFQTAQEFREHLMVQTLLHGNGLAEIEREEHRPKALWPLSPDRTRIEIESGTPYYITRTGDLDSREVRLHPSNVIHIKNFGPDAVWGYATLALARNSWGLGLAGEKYASKYFANNGRPSGVLEYPGTLKDVAYDRLKKDWHDRHEGLDNAARTSILEEGAKYTATAFSQKDSQWLESRQFQRQEVAAWFGLPPHKLGDLREANYSNMVESNLDYLKTSLMRWLVKWQSEFDRKLLTPEQRRQDSHFFEFNTAALLRGDTKSRFETYEIGIRSGILNSNEARARENLNARPGGDEYAKPGQYQTTAPNATGVVAGVGKSS